MVEGMPPRVAKRVLQPPPGKYSVIEGCQLVDLRQAFISALLISQNEVQEAVRRCGGDIGSRHAGDGIWAPIGAEIGKNLRGVGEQPSEEHGGAIQGIVFCCDDVRGAAAIPVERGIQNRLKEVAIRHVVGPLALALEA